ncbi:MAG TPA: hypothetical protein VK106_01240, partial [Balneolaceae bacterium]|nr:hypothetical protein [Balneolaceae bacterium]
ALVRYNIESDYEKAHFLSQCIVESGYLDTTLEYSTGEAYEPNIHSDAIKMGNTQKGDGPKYKGKGLIQLTWKNNYKAYSEYLKKGDLFVKQPMLVASNMYYAIDASCFYWRNLGAVHKKHNAKGNIGILIKEEPQNCKLVTLAVNGGYNGYTERLKIFNEIIKEWNLK